MLFCYVLAAMVVVGDGKLSNEEKKQLLEVHNEWRRQVANGTVTDRSGKVMPPAADMTKLIWSDKIAKSAQAWANVCPNGHESQKDYGENLAWGRGAWNWTGLAALWWHEIDDKPGRLVGSVDKFTRTMLADGIAHWTQLVWSKTWQLGCGAKICGKTKTLVCRYYFAGNFFDRAIYARGEACSKCIKSQTCEDGLCVGRPFDLDCIDGEHCAYFVGRGWCHQGQYVAFVRQRCPKSCEQC